MIQDNLNNSYDNSYKTEAKPSDNSFVLYFHNNDLLCHANGDVKSLETAIPGKVGNKEVLWCLLTFKEVKEYLGITGDELIYLFNMAIEGDKRDFFLLTDSSLIENTGLNYSNVKENGESDIDNPGGLRLKDLYYIPAFKFRSLKPLSTSFAVITACQLYSWYRDNRFCGRCGTHTIHDSRERMLKCPDCGNVIYPKICPGVIVGIIHKGRILLTKYANKGYDRYALVAGFTEIGETLEESVVREAYEEVGLRLKNITFYKSQPWSASSSLLAGFFAEVDGSDEVVLETEELKEGTWFYPEDIVQMHEGVSLTEEMINHFADRKLDERWYKN